MDLFSFYILLAMFAACMIATAWVCIVEPRDRKDDE